MAVMPYRTDMMQSLRNNNTETLALTQHLAGRMLIATCFILFLLSLAIISISDSCS